MFRFLSIAALVFAVAVGGVSRWSLSHFKRTNQNNLGWLEASSAGDQNAFLITVRSEATGGRYMTMQEFVRNTTRGFTPGYVGSPPPHIHPRQTETFTVLRGKMGYNLAGAFGEVEEGQSVTITPGLNHWFYNADPLSDCLFEVRLEPALAGDEFFEQIAGLSRDYGAASKVNPLQLMALFAAYDVDVGFMPPAVWRVVKRVVVPLADVLGFKTKYPEYRSAGGGGNAPRAATLRQRLAGEIEGITSQKAAEAAVVEE